MQYPSEHDCVGRKQNSQCLYVRTPLGKGISCVHLLVHAAFAVEHRLFTALNLPLQTPRVSAFLCVPLQPVEEASMQYQSPHDCVGRKQNSQCLYVRTPLGKGISCVQLHFHSAFAVEHSLFAALNLPLQTPRVSAFLCVPLQPVEEASMQYPSPHDCVGRKQNSQCLYVRAPLGKGISCVHLLVHAAFAVEHRLFTALNLPLQTPRVSAFLCVPLQPVEEASMQYQSPHDCVGRKQNSQCLYVRTPLGKGISCVHLLVHAAFAVEHSLFAALNLPLQTPRVSAFLCVPLQPVEEASMQYQSPHDCVGRKQNSQCLYVHTPLGKGISCVQLHFHSAFAVEHSLFAALNLPLQTPRVSAFLCVPLQPVEEASMQYASPHDCVGRKQNSQCFYVRTPLGKGISFVHLLFNSAFAVEHNLFTALNLPLQTSRVSAFLCAPLDPVEGSLQYPSSEWLCRSKTALAGS
ncbi:uncharacterized protein LOC125944940 isoform X3 [Dermacentor silvarum]|uniref:uncharacterized protein LOC125944940 isoform X3 n=1 Tax=Dermacentor silvarum TaxID=543639 RepID=UPI002101C146|nr:uncharacterized protein LOC125944940 isoform X3 [Dermacentor silvarum]